MLASRSLSKAAVKGSTRNISSVKYVSPARSFSSIASRPVLKPSSVSRLRLKANSYLPPASVSSLSFPRFNSTSTSDNEISQATEDVTAGLEDVLPNIEDIPEGLGYLKELGLDFGYGPSALMEWTIEHIHILGGLPWWASIVGAGLLVRLALFKPSIMAADNAARTSPLKDKMLALRTRQHAYTRQGNQLESAKLKVELEDLYKNNNIAMWKSFLPLLQLPLGFGTFRVVRGMSLLPVPALATEEFAWIHDLTTYDPLYIMPVLTTAFMYMALKKGSSGGATDLTASSLGRSVVFGLPVMSLLFIMWQPAALQLYFASTGLFGVIQAYLLNTPSTRAALGVAPIYKPSADALAASRFRMIRDGVVSDKNAPQQQQQQAEASSEITASDTKPENISLVDRMVNNAKKEFSTMRKEMNDKVEEYTGNNSTNADGTPQTKPRLTTEQKADADTYKALREIDDALATSRFNRQRMREFRKYQEAASPHAVRSWQDIRKKAKEALEAAEASTNPRKSGKKPNSKK